MVVREFEGLRAFVGKSERRVGEEGRRGRIRGLESIRGLERRYLRLESIGRFVSSRVHEFDDSIVHDFDSC